MSDQPAPPAVTRRAYTCPEFAAQFGKGKQWAYKLVAAGKVKVLRGYGGLLIPVEEVDRLVTEASKETP
jgi:hypothetical protein